MCICSVILGDFQSFRNYKGFSIIFPKMLDVVCFSNERIFLTPTPITFLNPKILGFFFYEKQHYLGSEMSEIKLQKMVGNLLHRFRKLYMNRKAMYKFVAVLKQ